MAIGNPLSTRLLAGSAIAFALSAAGGMSANAQEQQDDSVVDTIVVTASKRPENIQDVPMSVTAFSGDYLEQTGVNNATALMQSVPSVAITQSNNTRNTTVFIRGIGTSGTNPGIESSVGLFIDGVYLLGAGAIQGSLQDISTIEVLRGPQGTLYGRNTPVGAININTRLPTDDFEAMFTTRFGDYNAGEIGGYVGGGLSENLAGRISFWASSRDGYEENLSTGDDINGKDELGVRARMRWTPNANLTGDYVAYYSRMRSECCTAEVLNPTGPGGTATAGFLAAALATGHPFRDFTTGDHVVDDENVGSDVTDVWGGSATFDWVLENGFTLTSITGFNTFIDNIRNLPTDMLPQSVVSGSNQILDASAWSQEFRIASPAEQRFSYIAGLYLFTEDMRYNTQSIFGEDANRILPPCPGTCRNFPAGDSGSFRYTQETLSAALFGQATFDLTDAFRFQAGLRYSWDQKDATTLSFRTASVGSGTANLFPATPLTNLSREETELTWSAGLQYDITPDIMAYVIAATGYKTGGFNARSATAGTPLEFDAETTMTYEAGIKSVLWDRLVLNADIYSMTLSDFQDSVLNPLTGTGFIVGNAGERQVNGFEMDARWEPIDGLSLMASASYMDAEFTDYTNGQCNTFGSLPPGTSPGTCNYNGLTPAQSPEWSYSFAANWEAPISGTGLDWFVGADMSHVDEKFIEVTLDPRGLEPGHDFYNARLGIMAREGPWRVSLFGRNLTDEVYYVARQLLPLNAAISGGGTSAATGFVGWYGPPRTYGVELSARF